jgi:hypothetical protein
MQKIFTKEQRNYSTAFFSKSFFFEELKNVENRVAWFLVELCKAEKGVQNDKRNQRQTELISV